MFAHFLEATAVGPQETILDVGVTTDQSYESSNYLEAWYPHKTKVTALGIDDAAFLESRYPGVRFVQGDGLKMPFRARAFDVVHSSAVLEHVGSFEEQVRFISECARVARRSIYLTTPNRWFPVEFHVVLPLVHWLPKTWFRRIMRASGRGFFAEEANLNLMGASDLRRAASVALEGAGYKSSVQHVRLWGWPSNLLLIAHRPHALA
jgi:ubiquinone/menaquinone biosynthesis C-methylase UbiE